MGEITLKNAALLRSNGGATSSAGGNSMCSAGGGGADAPCMRRAQRRRRRRRLRRLQLRHTPPCDSIRVRAAAWRAAAGRRGSEDYIRKRLSGRLRQQVSNWYSSCRDLLWDRDNTYITSGARQAASGCRVAFAPVARGAVTWIDDW